MLGVGILAGGSALNAGLLSDRLLISFGAACWAAGSLVGRHGARPAVATQATAMQLATGAVWTLTASLLHGDLAHFGVARLTLRAVLALLFLVLCGTVLAFASFTWLMRVASPTAVSTYAFVNPVVALTLGVIVGDDRLSGRVILSAVLVVAAVALTLGGVSSTRPRSRAPSRHTEESADEWRARVAS
jgi:drug/metabolite transporter (DMT)-like permease